MKLPTAVLWQHLQILRWDGKCKCRARVVTINYTINFIKNLHAGDVATAVGTVIQRGHKIIIIKVETFNNEGTLLTEMLGTMYVIGKFETIPEKW